MIVLSVYINKEKSSELYQKSLIINSHQEKFATSDSSVQVISIHLCLIPGMCTMLNSAQKKKENEAWCFPFDEGLLLLRRVT